jgi:hypothetical protein
MALFPQVKRNWHHQWNDHAVAAGSIVYFIIEASTVPLTASISVI